MEADYVIVGAGTSGCVITRKLCDRGYSVLVLEAGTNNSTEEDIQNPSTIDSLTLTLKAEYVDNIPSVVQPVIGKYLLYSYGRVWGGSSATNGMLYVWGSPQLYKQWEILSDKNWSWHNIRKSLIQNETYTGRTEGQRGNHGPVDVYQNRYKIENTLSEFFVQAVHRVTGVPIADDYNAGYDECVAYFMQFSHKINKDGKKIRESSATAYLDPILSGRNKNITLLSKCTVNKVGIHGNRVCNVQYIRNGKSEKVYAKKEVILCAGVMTPAILQRSGIGDKNYLESLGITSVMNNSNVGRHLKVHNSISCAVEVETSRIEKILRLHPEAGIFGHAFMKLGHNHRRLQIIPFAFAEGIIPSEVFLANNWKFDAKKPTNIIAFFLVDLHPSSSGAVTIVNSDPQSNPKVNFRSYERKEDLNFGVQSYRILYKIVKEMRNLDKDGVYRIVYPPKNAFQEDLTNYVKASAGLFYHYASTARIGRSPAKAVVDSDLKVFGVEGLRVADLCVCPIIPDGNTEAAAFMIGQQAAYLI